MQDLPDFVPASSHHLKPLVRDGPQFTSMLLHPCIDGEIAFDSSVEPQKFDSHRRSIFTFGLKRFHWFSRLKDGMTVMEALHREAENQYGRSVKDNFGSQVDARPLAAT
jgi:hypothetical protein